MAFLNRVISLSSLLYSSRNNSVLEYIMEKKDIQRGSDAQRRDDDGDLWCRSSGIGDRRLPAGLGGLRIQGIKRSSGSGAPPTALVVSGVVNLHKGWVVFLFLMRAFVYLSL
jgi:hypothetical protein